MTEETLFAAALEKATPAERAAFLDEACSGDAALRRRVEALLASHEHAGFLKTPAVQRAAEELAGVVATQADPLGDEDAPLAFLAPSEKPGSLGRLGHYEVQEVVGKGGMGVVLRVFDEKLHRVVAIKVMARHLATTATARHRFLREARAAAAVSHDHLVTIHAVESADQLPYLVMQYVSGMSLQKRLDRDGPLQVMEIVRIGMQTAAGLAAAHAQGLIHRDVKPANILLENGVERVKLTDFGLARAAADASLTQSGVVPGTPHYMSPEQAQGEAIDQRSDLFSLGSVLYAMCTGRAPFRATGSMAVLRRVCDDTPTPIRDVNPDIPEWLVAIVDKLHAKNPGERYQSAAEVAELLSRQLALVQHPSVETGAFLSSEGGTVSEARPRARVRRLAVAAAVLLCLIGSLSVTEATGVTNLRATVVRILTPEGTKVSVEVLPVGEIGRFEGHTLGVQCIAVSADGRHALSGSLDQTAILWDLQTGQQRRRLRVQATVTALAFSPSRPEAALGFEEGTVALYDLGTGTLLRRFEGHIANVTSVVFSRDGRQLLSSSKDRTIRLWDVVTARQRGQIEGQSEFEGAVFCSDGHQVLSAGGKVVIVWDLQTGKERKRFEGHTAGLWSVALSSDGRRALSGGSDGAWLWDMETGEGVWLFGPTVIAAMSVAFSPDGRRILIGTDEIDRSLLLFDVETGKELHRFVGHGQAVRSVIFLPDGRHALTGSWDKTLRLWRLPPPGKQE